MLTLDNIDMSVNYNELCFIESHLMHEVKRRGTSNFVKVYGDNIEDFRRDWSKINFCFLLALLEHLDSNFKYDSSIKLDKYVLSPFDFGDLSDFGDELDLVLIYNDSLDSFKNRGFLYSNLGEAL